MPLKLMLLRCQIPIRLLPTPTIFSILRTNSTAAISSAIPTSNHSLSASYGPSLDKGTLPSKTHHLLTSHFGGQSDIALKPSQFDPDDEPTPVDETHFTRVFEIAALQVPSERCYELESRLRGHLLNWPRIRNIARVPGDEVDGEIQELLRIEDGDGVEEAVSRRIYGKAEGDGEELCGVLYRDKLAKEFNARGFVNFRNLAKISRPNKKNKKKRGNEGESGEVSDGAGKGIGRRKSVVVEVVEEGENDGDGVDLSGLLGDEFKGRKWRGSTRLLLLDERYATSKPGELPEALKFQRSSYSRIEQMLTPQADISGSP